jgi:hypothetical protein
MADVTVEFGATDTGLEKTLKAVQGELNSLKDKVKGGELSMTELESTMKRIGQVTSMEKNIKAIGDQSKGTSAQVKTLGTAAEDTGKKGEIGFGKIAVGATLAGAAAKLGSMAIDAAFSVALKTVQSFGDALNMGGRLNDLADRTGIAVDKVLLLERAFQNAGVGADSLGPIINKMQKALVDAEDGTSKAAYAFADLGLSLSKLQSMSPEEQLRTIGKAIADIPDPAKRASTAMEIFGKSGGALNQVFANFDDEIQTAKLQLGSLPDIMKAGSTQFDRISDNLVVVGGKFIEFAAGLIDKVKPALDAVTTALSMFDAAKVGQEIGAFFVGAGNGMKLFQRAVDEFKTGNFTDGFKLAWQAIVEQAKDTANSIYTNIVAAMKTVGDFIKDQFKSSGPLVLAITSAFDYVSGYIKKVVSGSLFDVFRDLGPAFANITIGLGNSAKAGALQAELALQRIPVAAELAADKASESMGDIPANFKKNMADVPPLFDKVTKKQDEVVKKTDEIIAADKEWEAQAMSRINNDVDASQKAFKEKRANQQTLAKDQTAEDERAANARKKYEEDHKKQAELKRDEIALQIKINEAIANGDTKLADSLKNTKELNKTIKELADAGLNEATKEAEKLANELARSAREADRVKNSLATKIDTQIKEKQKSESIDPSGKLQKKAQEQIAAGQYKAAAATGRQLADRELDTQLRGTGADRDRRSPSDIIKDYYGEKAPTGLTDKEQKELIRQAREEGQYKDTSKMTDTSKKGLDRFANLVPDEKKQAALDKAKKGMEKGVPEAQKDMTSKTGAEEGGAKGEGGKDSNSVMESIKTAVEAIKTAVEKIEPKLPTAALSA